MTSVPSGCSSPVFATEMLSSELLSLLLTPFCEAQSWKAGNFPSWPCLQMPLIRALRCNGRASPPTPGPSAWLLQLMLCRTALTLPNSATLLLAPVARSCPHTLCRWWLSPPWSFAEGTRAASSPRLRCSAVSLHGLFSSAGLYSIHKKRVYAARLITRQNLQSPKSR